MSEVAYRCDAKLGCGVRCMTDATWRVELLAQPDESNYACDSHIAEFLHFDEINTVRMVGAGIGGDRWLVRGSEAAMLVRAQRYGKNYWPTKQKYHWMVKPWLTACGREITDEWDLIPGAFDRRVVEADGCKQCGIGGDDE